jgi:RNA exonuclease 1
MTTSLKRKRDSSGVHVGNSTLASKNSHLTTMQDNPDRLKSPKLDTKDDKEPSYVLNNSSKVDSSEEIDVLVEYETRNDEQKPEWKKISRLSKKAKKNYPSLSTSRQLHLKGKIKIASLQALVLYLLADGPSPPWIAVNNKAQVQKVVVLLVTGLERGLFDGTISLDGSESDGLGEDALDNKKSNSSPDDYYPVKLSEERLPEPLKPMAEIFPQLWPVLTPGDSKANRVESPITSMLSVPLTKGQEKQLSKSDIAGKWVDQNIPIYSLLATMEELDDNEYVLHPALMASDVDRQNLAQKRQSTASDDTHGWVDTNVTREDFLQIGSSEGQVDSVKSGRDIYALDCEMCRTEGGELDLARISIVDWDNQVVMDELVKPERKIIDYLTP